MKSCKVCNRSFPDGESSCLHCGAATDMTERDVLDAQNILNEGGIPSSTPLIGAASAGLPDNQSCAA
ncbi:MAG: hypothetical protein WCW17_00815 [Patescibacteria group bacterium]